MKALLISALIIALSLWAIVKKPSLMLSPGKLSGGHENIPNQCMDCHLPFKGIPDVKCLGCHKPNSIGITKVDGSSITPKRKALAPFHTDVSRETSCAYCHPIHNQTASFKKGSAIWHEGLNQNSLKNCMLCHEKPLDALHKSVKEDCGTCHSTKKWKPADFDHNEFFRFDKNHKSDCKSCHFQSDYSQYSCYGCHEHSQRKIASEHLEEGIRNFEDCAKCHKSGNEHEAERIWKSGKDYLEGYGSEKSHKEHKEGKRKKRDHEDDDDDDD